MNRRSEQQSQDSRSNQTNKDQMSGCEEKKDRGNQQTEYGCERKDSKNEYSGGMDRDSNQKEKSSKYEGQGDRGDSQTTKEYGDGQQRQ